VHEMSLCESVVRILRKEARQHSFRRVKVVQLQVGALSCVMPEALEFCFRAVSLGTLAENARLDLVRVPGAAWCMACGETVEVTERYDACPQCGGFELQVTGGDELRISELEVE
jgi:hydrogenase nickel incorporation protein HypA/HybF